MNDDRSLALLVAQGNKPAFELLIRRHQRLVAHMVARLVNNPEDLEEICQDVFLKVYEKISEFSFQSKLSTWIATISYRHAINHMRKKRIELTDIDTEDDHSNYFISGDNPEEWLTDKDQEMHVSKLIDQLPYQYKAVLTLYHVEGMNYEEIGQATGMPDGTVKNYLFRARHLLKEKVKHYLGKEELQ
jgi:RNA polymerase sigma factor (sigma-70 family)